MVFKAIQEYGILYKIGERSILVGYTIADHASYMDEEKSITCYIFLLRLSPITLKSKK